MTARERRLEALHIAWQVLDAASVDINVGAGTDADIRAIHKELDKIAQSMFNRYSRAKEASS